MFYIDYNDTTIMYTTEEGVLAEGFTRLVANEPLDLAGLDNGVLLRMYNEGAPKAIKVIKDRDDAFAQVWARLTGQPAPEKDLNLVVDKKPRKSKKTSSNNDVAGNTEEASASATKEAQVATGKKAAKKASKKVAAKKKVAKKTAAPKKARAKSTGPRGEKVLAIKRLLMRKSGCTGADIL